MASSIDDLMGMLLGGRYRVVKLIGRGGMGAVHVARDEQLGSDVAVKVVREALLDDPAALARFKREARLLPELVHEHIVRAFSAGEDDGLLWIAMELLEGETLRQRIDSRGRMSWRDSLSIVRQIASALAAAHDKGVVHRDLKPENVIVLAGTPGTVGDIRLLDFGVAKGIVREGSGAASMTGTGMMIGTPGYIAPEVIVDGRADDPRSDLYALGVCWFEMLTGARPFTAKTPVALAMAHAHQPAPTPSSMLPFSPVAKPIEDVVMRLLAKTPEERPASAHEVITLLTNIEQAAADDERNPRKAQPMQMPPSMPTITDVRPTPSFAVPTGPATAVSAAPPGMTPAPLGTPSTGMVVPVGTPQTTPLPPFLAKLTGTKVVGAAAGALVVVLVCVGLLVVLILRSQQENSPPQLPLSSAPMAAPAPLPLVEHAVDTPPPDPHITTAVLTPPVAPQPVKPRAPVRPVPSHVTPAQPVAPAEPVVSEADAHRLAHYSLKLKPPVSAEIYVDSSPKPFHDAIYDDVVKPGVHHFRIVIGTTEFKLDRELAASADTVVIKVGSKDGTVLP